MHIVRFDQAPFYQSPGHTNMRMRRMQGMEAGPADLVWLGLSQVEPGGGIEASASEVEKFYVVLDGEITLSNGTDEVVLQRWDTCRFAANELRILSNRTSAAATVLLAMPLPRAQR